MIDTEELAGPRAPGVPHALCAVSGATRSTCRSDRDRRRLPAALDLYRPGVRHAGACLRRVGHAVRLGVQTPPASWRDRLSGRAALRPAVPVAAVRDGTAGAAYQRRLD